jgi:hypothetical protein
MSDMIKEFKNPGMEWRGKPFWSWNGKLEKEELIRQIHIMKEMGLGGFFMHSRTGLITEYLGEEWFELINACADEAEKLGMESWLYDEDRWPSGTAGGMVTEHPEFRQKSIRLEVFKADEFAWDNKYIGVWICSLNDKTYCNLEKIDKNSELCTCSEKSVLAFSIAEMGRSNFYNGYTYVDTMNREATDYFLKITHEKYAEKCGDRLGKSIKGIFTDEPHRGALLDGFSMYCEDGEWRAPYTYVLFDEFKKRFGYDLIDFLPELFLIPEGKKVVQVKWHYVELLQQLFIENFAIPSRNWCKEHNLILTGHVLHEDNLCAQTAMCGSMMRYYEHMDWPGVDVLSEGNKSFWIVKQLQSAARQLGRKWLLSELYGCTGWQMPFKGHKAVGDWQALFGINLRCHHLSWYSMQGEAKRDFPASILHQSPWYKEYESVETYFSRFGMLMAQGEPVCDVLVINPVESVWSQVHVGWSNILVAQNEDVKKLQQDYEDLFYWLLTSQIDFDYGDEEMMSRMGRIEQVEQQLNENKDNDKDNDKEKDKERRDVKFCVGKMKYKTVVVGQPTTIRSTTLKLLKEFAEAGGKVIFAGDVPMYVDALESVAINDFIELSELVPFERKSIVKAVKNSIISAAEILNSKTGEAYPDIFGQIRRTDNELIFAALNVNREDGYENATVRIKGSGVIEEWDCLNGTQTQINAESKDGWLEFKTDFLPAGEKIYMLKKESNAIVEHKFKKVKEIELNGPFKYELEDPNICVLDLAEWKMERDTDWNSLTEVLKIDQAVRNKFDLPLRSGEMLQPWYVAKNGINKFEKLKLKFVFSIGDMPDSVDLVLEEIDKFTVKINGKNLNLSNPKQNWIDKAFYRVEVPNDYLKNGENEIELETLFSANSNIEAIYLLGDFGVELEGIEKTLSLLPEKIKVGDLTNQKMPFYSGGITYFVDIPDLDITENNKVNLKLNDLSAACAVVSGKGKKQIVGWDPYKADITDLVDDGKVSVKAILTRRNTFGPLHQLDDNVVSYGPLNYITEGDEFTNESLLCFSGILKNPIVEILEEL